ncbi:MAG: RsmB/NOP family class I SAM-dependent RNA methyltransferase [Proteobacteria bacterium]|nr:RsmB/NOP family class I SAM-dependent RNA methyltransferase [Pseudomonadota bacterium]
MTPEARLKALSEILKEVFEFQTLPADKIVSNYVRKRRYIGSKDRRFLSSHLYTLLRNRGPLLFYGSQFGGERDYFEKEVILYALIFLKYSFEEAVSLCDGGIYHLSGLTQDEKKFLKNLNFDKELPKWALLSYPKELISFLERFELSQENFDAKMRGLLTEAPLDLRVNTLKTTREDVLRYFDKEGIEAYPTPYSPLGIRLLKRIDLSQNPLFKKGEIEVQDEGSQLISFLLAPQPGDRVLDLCAGGGGKALGIAALMRNKGVLIATDINPVRLKNAKERFRRAGVHIAETRVLENNVNDKWLKRQKEKFDCVLADVPCSGSGTWRRNPDQKWKLKISDIEELQKRQLEILNKAALMVKKGGKLVYATCSLFYEENEDIVVQFMKENDKDFILEEASSYFEGEEVLFEGKFLKLDVSKTHTDGFFAAVFKRV